MDYTTAPPRLLVDTARPRGGVGPGGVEELLPPVTGAQRGEFTIVRSNVALRLSLVGALLASLFVAFLFGVAIARRR